MKKSIYRPYLIFLTLLLVPLTACTTKTAAEKPQEPPARQEQPVVDASSRAVPAQPVAAETAKQPDADSLQPAPQDAAAKPDAVSGATTDTVSGATVSLQSGAPRKEAPRSDAETTAAADNSAAQQPTDSSPALAAEPVVSGTVPAHSDTAPVSAPAEPVTAAADDQSIHSDTADIPAPAASAEMVSPTVAAEQTPIAANTEAASPAATAEPAQLATSESVIPDPMSTAEEPAQSVAASPEADTQEPVPEQAQPDYETSLADLITDFERQGGTHGYESPPTFHEEMLDLFSPQIFTVALSKEPETEQKPKVSRMVAVEEKQRLEITYPGHGWVYVGEQTSQPGLKYEQRKLQDENSIFMFTAERKGDYVLHFSYFDVFTNDFITDAVAVSVSAARSAAAKSTVKAPEYQNGSDSDTVGAETTKAAQTAPQLSSSSDDIAEAVSAAQSAPSTAASQAAETAGGSTGQASESDAAEEALSPDQLLEKARTAIASADAGAALTYLDTFFTTAEQKLDEGWFLRGRAYELNGSARNIRLALDAYRTLTDTFPQSKFWAEADARIRYITGFYINIR
ncbi:hypothetical protein [Treponema vincentii]|uniref:hypothetical protein n=1 Tax=Treponema vincentii TaxID=69710 RepID=UPI003D8BAFFA